MRHHEGVRRKRNEEGNDRTRGWQKQKTERETDSARQERKEKERDRQRKRKRLVNEE